MQVTEAVNSLETQFNEKANELIANYGFQGSVKQ